MKTQNTNRLLCKTYRDTSVHFGLQYAGQDFVGIVQNRDDLVTTIYDYGAIVDAELKDKVLRVR